VDRAGRATVVLAGGTRDAEGLVLAGGASEGLDVLGPPAVVGGGAMELLLEVAVL
jgi:hypothetical protein